MSADSPPAEARPGRLAPTTEPAAAAPSPIAIDSTDRAIIGELNRDGRLSIRALASRVNVSRTNAYARLERLVDGGVITGFGARIDPRRAGLATSAYVMVTIEQNAWRSVADELRRIPHVEQVTLLGGDFDILVLVRTPDNATLRDVVLGRIQDVERIRSTRTWLVFEEAPGVGSWPPPPRPA
jgi:DNA-binding Lrp family transcriptional regulator